MAATEDKYADVVDLDDGQVTSEEEFSFDPMDQYKDVIAGVKDRNPNVKLYASIAPFSGLFIYRPQTLKDTQKIGEEVSKFTTAKVEEIGADRYRKLSELERARINRDIDDEAGDLQNELVLKLCVVYPEDFATRLEEKSIPAGIYSLLVSRIMAISGFTDVPIREI